MLHEIRTERRFRRQEKTIPVRGNQAPSESTIRRMKFEEAAKGYNKLNNARNLKPDLLGLNRRGTNQFFDKKEENNDRPSSLILLKYHLRSKA